VTGTLYVVGTPIGNLEDLTARAGRVLSEVGVVAAEDTRRTGLLLKRLGATARLISMFEGNEPDRVPLVLGILRSGQDVAVVSDAGMPSVSDPGYRLVAACVEGGVPVDVVPGPSAAIAALVVSGLPTDRFAFEGFLPRSGSARRTRLAQLSEEPRTIILFESPRRLEKTLGDLAEALGERRVAVARELTKLHQEVLRGALTDVQAGIRGRELKGEIAVVVEGRRRPARADPDQAARLARGFLAAGVSKREAARRAASGTGGPSRDVYERLIRPPTESPDEGDP